MWVVVSPSTSQILQIGSVFQTLIFHRCCLRWPCPIGKPINIFILLLSSFSRFLVNFLEYPGGMSFECIIPSALAQSSWALPITHFSTVDACTLLLTDFEKERQQIDRSNSPMPITETVTRLTEFQILTWGCKKKIKKKYKWIESLKHVWWSSISSFPDHHLAAFLNQTWLRIHVHGQARKKEKFSANIKRVISYFWHC